MKITTSRIAHILVQILLSFSLVGTPSSQESLLNQEFETDLESITIQDFANLVNDKAGYDFIYVPLDLKCKFSMFYQGNLGEILQMVASTCDLNIETTVGMVFFSNKYQSKPTIVQYDSVSPPQQSVAKSDARLDNSRLPQVHEKTLSDDGYLNKEKAIPLKTKRDDKNLTQGKTSVEDESILWTVSITIIISLILSALMILPLFVIVRFLVFRRPLKTWAAIIIPFVTWFAWHMILNIYSQEPTNTSIVVIYCIGGYFILKYEKKPTAKETFVTHPNVSPPC